MTSLHSLQTAINQIFQQTREVTISVYIIYAIIAARWEDVAVQLLSEEHQKEKRLITMTQMMLRNVTQICSPSGANDN